MKRFSRLCRAGRSVGLLAVVSCASLVLSCSSDESSGPAPIEGPRQTSSWDQFRDPDYEFCQSGCEELAELPVGHGPTSETVRLVYDPNLKDEIAMWGDCLGSVFACYSTEEADLSECVGASNCPADCKQEFAGRTAGSSSMSELESVFDEIFLTTDGYCMP